jgi:DNA-binding beta-propeller fold protein YncE
MTTQTLTVSLQYSHSIGRGEFSGPGFRNPVAAARGADDTLYVVNRAYEYRPDGKRITICTVDEDYIGEFARGVASAGVTDIVTDDGSLIWPTSVALDKDGNVYVADEWLNRISMFTSDGDWIGKWGTEGSGNGEINRPSGMVFDSENTLVMVDSQNNRIQKFTKDGTFISAFGSQGSGDGQFNLPWGIDVDSDDNIYVADWRNDRIQKFSKDGEFLMKIGSAGTEPGEFRHPTDVAVDRAGMIYVADWANERLQMFDPAGRFVTLTTGDGTISKWGKDKLDANSDMWELREISQGLERERDFWGAIGVTVDDQDRVFVVESCRNRIQIYRKQEPMFRGGGRL